MGGEDRSDGVARRRFRLFALVVHFLLVVAMLWSMFPGHGRGFFVNMRWFACGLLLALFRLLWVVEAKSLAALSLSAAFIYNPFFEIRQSRDAWLLTDLFVVALSTIASIRMRNPAMFERALGRMAPLLSAGFGLVFTVVHVAAGFSGVSYFFGPTMGVLAALLFVVLKPGLLSLLASFVGAYLAWEWSFVPAVMVAAPGLVALFSAFVWGLPMFGFGSNAPRSARNKSKNLPRRKAKGTRIADKRQRPAETRGGEEPSPPELP